MENEIQVRDSLSSKEKGILLSLLVIPCLLVFTRPLDNDIWFLLNSGRYVLENGIPHTEPFTIHQDWNFVMQQWLSGVLFWVTFDNLGETGLKLLVMFVNGLIVFLAYRLCMRVSEKNFFVSHATAFAISIMLSPFMTERPYIYSSLILLAEIYALESYLIKKNNKYLLGVAVFINLDGESPCCYVANTDCNFDSISHQFSSFQIRISKKRWI